MQAPKENPQRAAYLSPNERRNRTIIILLELFSPDVIRAADLDHYEH